MLIEPLVSPVTHLTNLDIIVRLVLATALAALVGIEREYNRKPAGLRTNVMVGLGSAIFTIASMRALDIFPELKTVDPTRIAAQIVSGISFLGIGTILFDKDRSSVTGLTTAATLWVVAGVGMAVGFGFYVEAITATALVFFTFLVLSKIVGEVRKRGVSHGPEHHDHKSE